MAVLTKISVNEINKMYQIILGSIAPLAMTVKVIVLLLGAGGIATLWEAVFADIGVALLAILNAYRIQNKVV